MAAQLLKVVVSVFFVLLVAVAVVAWQLSKDNDDDWPQGGAAA